MLRLTGFTEIGRALLAPVGGGTHQESRNNGDRLEPWKGHPAAGQDPGKIRRGSPAGVLPTSTALRPRESAGARPRPELVYLNGKRREDLERKPGSGPGSGQIRRDRLRWELVYLNGVEALSARERPPAGGIHPAIVEVNRITQIARR